MYFLDKYDIIRLQMNLLIKLIAYIKSNPDTFKYMRLPTNYLDRVSSVIILPSS